MPLSPTTHATPAQNIKEEQKIVIASTGKLPHNSKTVIPSAMSKLANNTKTRHSERSEESAFSFFHAFRGQRTQ
jgi:hypothetical protein